MLPLAINGIGPVAAFGAGMTNLQAVLTGKTGVTPEITRIRTRGGSYDLPVFRADPKPLKEFIKPRKLRRLDNFSRLALLGAILAVEDSATVLDGERTGLIVASAHGATATTFAFLDSVINDGDALASPTLFSNSVHNAAAAHIAEHFQITGPTLSLTQGADSLTLALLTAGQWLESGKVDTVLCGVIDCYCEVLGYCWQSYREQHNVATPNSISDPGIGPGEGTVFFRLSRNQENSPKPKYGYLNKIELNQDAPPPSQPFISSGTGWTAPAFTTAKTKDPGNSPPGNRIELNLAAHCGELPILTSFDLAAAVLILNDQQLIDGRELPQIAGNRPSVKTTICCWQPHRRHRQKPLTGNCYWITDALKI